jgi:uncharacterized oxidoreductase
MTTMPPAPASIEVTPDALRDYVAAIFVAGGAPEADARVVAAHLVEANQKGHDSHGVVRVPRYAQLLTEGIVHPGTPIVTVQETESTALVDGGWNFGAVVAHHAMALAIAKARATGIGAVAAFHATHAGRMGAYAEQAIAEGMIGIVMANVHGGGRMVAPYGGAQRRLATNPLAVGAPTEDPDAPFVLDMATSIAAEGKFRVAQNRGQPVPDGWLLDADGAPSTDPGDLYSGGAILPLAGYKGFGLSMAVEALAGALSPAGTSRPDAVGGGNGLFMLALDPERFVGRAIFATALSGLVDYVKQPPFQPGTSEVLVAGEPERRRMAERAERIPIDEETWRQIGATASALGVAVPVV